MSVQSFKKKYLHPVFGRDGYRYDVHAWVEIDGLALFKCKDDEERKQLIRTVVMTIKGKITKLIADDLKELDKEERTR